MTAEKKDTLKEQGVDDNVDEVLNENTLIKEKLNQLIEDKEYKNALESAFSILKQRKVGLMSEALEKIQEISTLKPSIFNPEHFKVLVSLLHDEDAILRAATVLTLKPMTLERPDDLLKILKKEINQKQAGPAISEEIRLLAHIATKYPEKIKSLIEKFILLLKTDDINIAKRSLSALKILSNDYPTIIEDKLQDADESIKDKQLKTDIDDFLTSLIKKRERSGDNTTGNADEVEDIIPDVTKARTVEDEKEEGKETSRDTRFQGKE
ncbi:MAG: hypothetical protein ACTSYS_16240, partial [Promethearchaeota archaeon]